MKAPSIRAADLKQQQGHRGTHPPPLTGPAQSPPRATGPPALTQNPPWRCTAGKKKSTERQSWKMVLPSKCVRLKDKNKTKTHQNKRVSLRDSFRPTFLTAGKNAFSKNKSIPENLKRHKPYFISIYNKNLENAHLLTNIKTSPSVIKKKDLRHQQNQNKNPKKK